VTHSVPVITICAARDNLERFALGGSYHAKTRSFTGPLTRAALSQLAVDVAVLSAAAAGLSGVYSADPWDADTKQGMVSVADRIVLLVDTVIVDAGATSEQLSMLRGACGRVVVAPVDEGAA
jgi:DeoR/GlpR family transcriptional regulator of sugar metabolism